MNSTTRTLATALALAAAPFANAQAPKQSAPMPSPSMAGGIAPQPQIDSIALQRAHDILRQTYREVKANYYDPTFHGLDLDARFQEYDARLNSIHTQGDGFRIIAAFLSGFHDSHLFFGPPSRPYRYDAGYRSSLIGDMDYVTHVRPGTDATEKLSPGDRIVHMNGYNVNRQDEHEMMYYFHVLAPRITVDLDISTPGGEQKKVTITSKTKPRPKSVNLDSGDVFDLIRDEESDSHLYRGRTVEVDDVLIWKMPEFNTPSEEIDRVFRKAQSHKAFIIDLRGNPGGRIDTLKYIIGHLLDHDTKIFDEVSRKQTKPIIAKTMGSSTYKGKLIILIDSSSASCAELMPRVMQLEHRATILGDLSAGAVMESMGYPEQVGADNMIFYSLSITHANALMADGKSLENVGVMPDERILPNAEDLYSGKDPVLAHAIDLAGGKSDPTAAGKLFPFEWPTM